jgi:hypothetical protein
MSVQFSPTDTELGDAVRNCRAGAYLFGVGRSVHAASALRSVETAA